jgi:hypothetical protein
VWGGRASRIGSPAVPHINRKGEQQVDFTELQKEILTNGWALAREGKGQVLQDWAMADAHELEQHGWLETRTEPNGHTSWWWTHAAETALDMNTLTNSTAGREN